MYITVQLIYFMIKDKIKYLEKSEITNNSRVKYSSMLDD